VLRLTTWEGLGPTETAAVLGCSTTAVKVRLHRARQRLRAALSRADAVEARSPSAARLALADARPFSSKEPR
jgi:RNA polymerase sigma-70 factor (ECF subfamily)